MIDTSSFDPIADLGAEGATDLSLIVGRKKANVALTPEPGGAEDLDDAEIETGGDSFAEFIGETIFRNNNRRLETEPERAEFGSDIDGLEIDERTGGEQGAIDGTLDDLEAENTLDVEVIAVDVGKVETIATEEGVVGRVVLNEGETSRVIDVGDNKLVLIIDDELSVPETIEEVIDVNEQLITEVAERNGVVVDNTGLRKALHFYSKETIENYYQMRYFGALRSVVVDTVTDDIHTRPEKDGTLR